MPLFSLSRSLIHEAAPPACHRPAYTVYGTNAELFLLLSRLPSAQAHSIRHLLPDDASTSLGCRAAKFPRWQPFKPPSLQHRRHPDQHRGFSWSGDMITDKRKKKQKGKKKILLLRFLFFSKSVVDDQTKIFKVRLCGSRQTSFSALTHTHILRFAAQPGIAHMHRERERDRNNGKNTDCSAACFVCPVVPESGNAVSCLMHAYAICRHTHICTHTPSDRKCAHTDNENK